MHAGPFFGYNCECNTDFGGNYVKRGVPISPSLGHDDSCTVEPLNKDTFGSGPTVLSLV